MSMSKFLVEEKEAPIAGTQRIYKFDNGLGASVVPEFLFATGEKKVPAYELAVIKWAGDEWDFNHNTPVTSDVLRFLSETEVETNLRKISKLEKGVY